MAIDQKLRERVDKEIGEFNAAFDAALSSQNAQALEELARAADRLMRVIGRVLIEVKRPP